MCVVSFIGDHFHNTLPQQYPWINTQTFIPNQPLTQPFTIIQGVPQAEFDALKKEVEGMKELLRKAKIYDEENNEPECQIEEKMEVLRKIAAMVGISLDDVIKPKEV